MANIRATYRITVKNTGKVLEHEYPAYLPGETPASVAVGYARLRGYDADDIQAVLVWNREAV